MVKTAQAADAGYRALGPGVTFTTQPFDSRRTGQSWNQSGAVAAGK